MKTDAALVRDYALNGSEAAFREIVERYLPLVHSAALRMLNGDTHRAQDVAQTVFADLARKAKSLDANVVLATWLWSATHHAAAKVVRTEQRRVRREETAARDQELTAMSATESEQDWEQLRPALDEALAELPTADRDAVLLRYFKRCELRAVGEMLGLSEDAARKRVSRALDKLHSMLLRRGITLSVAALAATLGVHAVTATPVGLATTIATTSLATAASAGSGVSVLHLIAMSTKAKVAIAASIGMLFVSGAGYGLWTWHDSNRGLRAQPIELAGFYNGSLDENWVGSPVKDNTLASLPRGRQTFGGVRFQVGSGLIQLSGREFVKRKFQSFPTNVADIRIERKFDRLHLLHGASYEANGSPPIATVTLHYEDGKTHTLMLNYDFHVANWWFFARKGETSPPPPKSETSVLDWTGRNPAVGPEVILRLFRSTFENPRPNVHITNLEYGSLMTASAPFLLALSVD